MAKLLRGLALFCLTALCLGPFLFMVSTSFEGGDLFKLESAVDLLPNQFTLDNYREVFERLPNLKYYFLNTGLLCFFGVALELLFATLAAYPLARMEFGGKGWVMGALLATMMLPAQANIIVNFVTIRQMTTQPLP